MNEKLKEYKQFKDLEPNKYFQLGNVTLKTVEHEKRKDNLKCEYCYMYENDIARDIMCNNLQELGMLPNCLKIDRKDNKDIIFKEVKFDTSLLEVIDRDNECLIELYGEIISEELYEEFPAETVKESTVYQIWVERYNVLFKTSEGKIIKLVHDITIECSTGKQLKDTYYLKE